MQHIIEQEETHGLLIDAASKSSEKNRSPANIYEVSANKFPRFLGLFKLNLTNFVIFS